MGDQEVCHPDINLILQALQGCGYHMFFPQHLLEIVIKAQESNLVEALPVGSVQLLFLAADRRGSMT